MSVVEQQSGMTDLLPCNGQCGGDYDKYSFGQTDKEVTLHVPLQAETTAKQVSVQFTPTSLKVVIRDTNVILEGKLFKPIKASESSWYIENRKVLFITLTKTNLKYEEWWPHVIEGERQIDMKTLRPPEVHLSELDEGAQATVSRMMFEQQQKRAGLATSADMDYPRPPL